MRDLGKLHEIPAHVRTRGDTHLPIALMTREQVEAVNEANLNRPRPSQADWVTVDSGHSKVYFEDMAPEKQAEITEQRAIDWANKHKKLDPHFDEWADITDTSYYDAMKAIYYGG